MGSSTWVLMFGYCNLMTLSFYLKKITAAENKNRSNKLIGNCLTETTYGSRRPFPVSGALVKISPVFLLMM
jgi:hypothetical protein